MAETKKYFWLKLKNDFFKRHDIRIIESMENGKDYILFYMKLLVESVSHEGELRFSDSVPYDERMLSVITNTNIDIVRSAVKIFTELNMMETLDDGTIFLQEVQKMVGYETSDAIRMRKLRAGKHKEIAKSEQCSKPFKKRSPELELELEKDIDINKQKHQYGEYKNILLTDEEMKRQIKKYGQNKFDKAILFYSAYKIEKGYKTKNDNLTMQRWVYDAIENKNIKQQQNDDWRFKK